MRDDEKHRDTIATERGIRVRATLLGLLAQGGPQDAADLLPQMPKEVSLSEIAFQLDRLSEEGATLGEQGGAYRIA